MHRPRELMDRYREARTKILRDDCLLGEILDAEGWPAGQSYYLPQEAIEMHLHVLGSTRRGKSKAVEAIVKHLIEKNRGGMLLLDPGGDFYREMVRFCAAQGLEDRVLLLDPSEDYILGFNPLIPYTERQDPTKSTLNAFNKVYGVKDFSQTKRLRRWARNTFYALIDNQLNLTEGYHLLDPYEKKYRKAVLNNIKKHDIRRGFEILIEARPERVTELTESTYNWFSPFTDSAKLAWIFGQRKTVIDIEKAYQEKKIILANLSQEAVDEEERKIIGTIILNAFAFRAFEKTEGQRVPWYPIVDECHQFINPDILAILRMAGKYKFFLTLIHQDPSDFQEEAQLWQAVMSNAQSKLILGGIGAEGLVEILRKEMAERLNPAKLMDELELEGDETKLMQSPNWRLFQLLDETINLEPQTCLVSPFREKPVKTKVKNLPDTDVSQRRLDDFKEYIFTQSGCYSHFEDVKKEIQERRDKLEQTAREGISDTQTEPKSFRHKKRPTTTS